MRRCILAVVIAQSLCLASPGLASSTFYATQAEWLGATENVEAFDTTSSNIALCNEVSRKPTGNSDLG